MRLHLVGIFHTRATAEYSHCAFTGKALRFPRMMQAQGYECVGEDASRRCYMPG